MALLFIIALAIGLGVSKVSAATETIVNTDGGSVMGFKQDDSFVFKGIPYAKPPIGELRWTSPRACKEGDCWDGILEATDFGAICPQYEFGTKVVRGTENCLFLNVWTPDLRPEMKRPVLFYIHGGFLTEGSGTMFGQPTPELVKAMDIVAVSFNYRLNAFGFLALDALALDSPTNTSGNYGFMDQIMALKWVRKNIEKFGGDPDRITLLGQSSGGTSELALLASPLAKGLFHRAVVMSGSPVFNKSSSDAAKDNEVFLKKAKCTSQSLADIKACLYRLSPEAVLQAIPWNTYPYWAMRDQNAFPTPGLFDGAVATVDGYVVPLPPIKAMAERIGVNDVPIMIGNTAQETDYFPPKDFSKSTIEEFKNYSRKKLLKFMSSADVDKILAMYVKNNSHHSPKLYYSDMVSDMRVICPTDLVAKNATSGLKSDVYRYIVTNRPSKPVQIPLKGAPPRPYAFHVWDLESFFGLPNNFMEYNPSNRDKSFMKDLRREIGSFMQTGKVESAAWKSYPENTALFTNHGLKVVPSYHKEECQFWMSRGFFSYAWIN